MYYPFNEQRGAYKVLMRNRFIFVKNDLHPVMEKYREQILQNYREAIRSAL